MGVKIGLDAEFSMVTVPDGRVQSASNYLEHHDRFGTDANSSIAEVRPFPSEDIRYIINSMSRMMKMKCKRNPTLIGLKWIAGSYGGGYPLGAHIHFGTYRRPSGRMLDYLDTLLAASVSLTERGDRVSQRASSGYGLFGAYRNQSWGWEYRTLLSFVSDKKFTEGVLELAKAIVYHCIELTQKGKDEVEEKEFFKISLTAAEKGAYKAGGLERLSTQYQPRKQFLYKWMPQLRYISKVDYVFTSIEKAIAGRYCISDIDMRRSWGLIRSVRRRRLSEIWKMEVV